MRERWGMDEGDLIGLEPNWLLCEMILLRRGISKRASRQDDQEVKDGKLVRGITVEIK